MKKFLFVAVLALASVMAYAQPRAIGGRIGYGFDVSYQHSVGDNMVSIDLGIPGFNCLEIAATHDWIDPFGAVIPWNEAGEWHWYMGVGAAFQADWYGMYGFAGAAGRFGIEYDFDFPLQISFDYRPALGCLWTWNGAGAGFGHDTYAGAIGLAVRYKF